MTDNEVSRLTRKELIEMLLSLTEENDRLKEENERLLKEAKQRKIAVESSGTMAEAALKLNRVFEAADAAAKQYLQNIKARADADRAKAEDAEKAERTEKHFSTAENFTETVDSPENTQSDGGDGKQEKTTDEGSAGKGLKKWVKKK